MEMGLLPLGICTTTIKVNAAKIMYDGGIPKVSCIKGMISCGLLDIMVLGRVFARPKTLLLMSVGIGNSWNHCTKLKPSSFLSAQSESRHLRSRLHLWFWG